MAVATGLLAIPRLPRRARVALLTVHIAVSVGWLGLIGAQVALEVTALSVDDAALQGGIAAAMGALARWVLVPVVVASLASGLVLALSTPWGLVRHWWVLAKCGIAVTVAASGLVMLLSRLDQTAATGGEPAAMQTLVARAAALVLLLAATGISVVKPWGKTPRGRAVRATGTHRGASNSQPPRGKPP